MKITAVDQGQFYRGLAKRFRGIQPAKAAAENNNAVEVGQLLL